MQIRTCTLAEANAFVDLHHRHHQPVVGHKFSIKLVLNETVVGVAICGRPVARKTDQVNVLEVARLCTDGSKNACSALYAACTRAAKELGYKKIQTFILDTEPGTSLRASGWSFSGVSRGGVGWLSRANRKTDQPVGDKHRYERVFW